MRVGLITEGVTDQIILRPILECVFGDELEVTALQPVVDESGRQDGFGGWQLVFRSIQELEIEFLLERFSLLVIQIDTDVSHMKGFDVPQVIGGGKLDAAELCSRVVARLRGIIPLDSADPRLSRFVFAVGVQSMECWLLGLVDKRHSQRVTNDCLIKLNAQLAKAKQPLIASKGKNSPGSNAVYRRLAGQFLKDKVLRAVSKQNVGFAAFLEQLDALVHSLSGEA